MYLARTCSPQGSFRYQLKAGHLWRYAGALHEARGLLQTHACGTCRDEPFIDKWFGVDGSKRMQFETFRKFLVKLHGIFDGMEFDMLDVKGAGHISGLELARSFVAPGPVTSIDPLLDRVRRHIH